MLNNLAFSIEDGLFLGKEETQFDMFNMIKATKRLLDNAYYEMATKNID